jgi:GAF domain-containing protein
MMREIQINKNLDKEEKYIELTKQVKSLIDNEEDHIANLSNICAAISETHKFLWTGFYIVKGNELVLGPFQGPVACTRIAYGNGVCGTSWKNKKTIIVEDVNSFPGHIVCSSKSKSEIVIPIFNNGNVYGVLDVDDSEYATFDETDQKYLKEIVRLFEEKLD